MIFAAESRIKSIINTMPLGDFYRGLTVAIVNEHYSVRYED